jgi:hypothetical protein
LRTLDGDDFIGSTYGVAYAKLHHEDGDYQYEVDGQFHQFFTTAVDGHHHDVGVLVRTQVPD